MSQAADSRPLSETAADFRRRGDALLAAGAFAAAADSYRQALRLEPGSVRGHNNLGQALMRLGRHAEAGASYERAIGLDPRYAIGYNNLGIALYEQGAYELALTRYGRALEIDPSFAEAHYNSGNALVKLGRPEAALERYDRALVLKPGCVHAETLSNFASVLLALRRPEEALRYCELALQRKPNFAAAYNNLGGALRKLYRYDEARRACERALTLEPDSALALSNLANIMLASNRFEEAIAYCDRALTLRPELPEALEQRAGALLGAKRPEEAAACYARLLEIEPNFPLAPGSALGARLACCDWTRYEQSYREVARSVQAGQCVIQPFAFLAISDSPELQLRCAQIHVAEQLPATARLPWSATSYQHERIRVAYLSADFHEHATSMLMAGLFEAHDRQRFETIAISFGADDSSPLRERLRGAFDRFIDIRHMSDMQVVQLMQSMEIDIAVDLKGYTAESRPGILARRPAPVQVNYLGYPGTMGLEQIDYILADPVVLPPEQGGHYSESVAYLPECYQVNDDRRVIAEHTPTRGELGLPSDGFVFCCFNNHYKIAPATFTVWMQLLQQIPASVLWLLEDNAAAARNLRSGARSRGIDAARLVFAPRLPAAEHLARQRVADLFLDTLPYNAHTTTSDALWAGLPVLTCLGNAFPGRVAASLLHAVGLPELITHTLEEYAARALELASDPEQLGDLRGRLARNRGSHPLFDTARFCSHLETAYTMMWRRQQDGLRPESFAVPPLART